MAINKSIYLLTRNNNFSFRSPKGHNNSPGYTRTGYQINRISNENKGPPPLGIKHGKDYNTLAT